MRRLRAIEGGATGGLDPRRARLARVHDVAILALAASFVALPIVGFAFAAEPWSGPAVALFHVALAGAVLGVVSSVATVYMVAFIFDADPRTQRERARLPDPDEPAPPDI